MNGNNIVVCVPARDMVHNTFAFCMANACAYHVAVTEDAVTTICSAGTLICSQRQSLVEQALAAGATHLMWFDSDMRFPIDVISRLLQHDLPIVACNYSQRVPEALPTATKYVDDKIVKVYTDENSRGLEEVDYAGMGVMLVRREVFEKVDKPWFAIPWTKNGSGFVGEDVFFCRRAREKGFKTYIDHDLSREIGHIGSFDYTLAHSLIVRDAKKAEQTPQIVLAQ